MLIIIPLFIILIVFLVLGVRLALHYQEKVTTWQKFVILFLFLGLLWGIYEYIFVFHVQFEF